MAMSAHMTTSPHGVVRLNANVQIDRAGKVIIVTVVGITTFWEQTWLMVTPANYLATQLLQQTGHVYDKPFVVSLDEVTGVELEIS